MTALQAAAERKLAPFEAHAADLGPKFAPIYESYFSFVWRSARRLGVHESQVDDVVQEIFVVVHRQLVEFEGRSSIKTWLFGITLNVVRAYRRTLRTRPPHAPTAASRIDPESLTDATGGPHEAALKAEAARLVDRILDGLDDDKRAVFILSELEQLGAPEIASALEIPVNTVYSRLRLARQEFAAAAARHRASDEWRSR
ncbi:MAG TPA: sigma-70 family RNA polymerase sigma factor [Polyangiaceae bacterium]|jgi:RNA polymerase sigma-70 factor (ECF subfamily)|nr:sigma-70 family RNA polymerase sigma factor [Polyangiaceae bacterium]